MNFWGYIIEGITSLLQATLSPFPDGLVNPILAQAAVIAYYGIAPVLFFVGWAINLQLLVTTITAGLAIEAIRLIIAGIRLVYKLIPALG